MGERDRNQSYGERNEGRFQNRDEYRRDRDDDWRTQSRDQGASWRDDRDYGRDYQRDYGSRYSERDYGQRFGGYESRRFPGTFGSQEDQRYGRDWNREWNRDRSSEWDRNQDRGYYQDRNQPYRGAYGRSYEADYRDRGDYRGREEGFGQQLKEAGQRFMGKVKRVFRSPKGYKRSDERIREDVNDRLGHEEQLDPTEIEVTVSSGEVTLTGTVNTRHEKFLAEEIADDVGGVTEVHNQLRVGRSQTMSADTVTSTATQAGTEAARNRNARAQ